MATTQEIRSELSKTEKELNSLGIVINSTHYKGQSTSIAVINFDYIVDIMKADLKKLDLKKLKNFVSTDDLDYGFMAFTTGTLSLKGKALVRLQFNIN